MKKKLGPFFSHYWNKACEREDTEFKRNFVYIFYFDKLRMAGDVELNPGPIVSCDRCMVLYSIPQLISPNFMCSICWPFDDHFYRISMGVARKQVKKQERLLKKSGQINFICCMQCNGRLPDIIHHDNSSEKGELRRAVRNEACCKRCIRKPRLTMPMEIDDNLKELKDSYLKKYEELEGALVKATYRYEESAFYQYWTAQGCDLYVAEFLPYMRRYLRHIQPYKGGFILSFNRIIVLIVSRNVYLYPFINLGQDCWPYIPAEQWIDLHDKDFYEQVEDLMKVAPLRTQAQWKEIREEKEHLECLHHDDGPIQY